MVNSDGSGGDERVRRWKHLTSSSNEFQLDSIRVIESNVFASQLIKFDRTIALVGSHGAGKSLLLKVIEACFGYSYSLGYYPPFIGREWAPRSSVPTLTGVMDVTIKTPTGLISRTIDISKPRRERREIWKQVYGYSFDAFYIDPQNAFSMLGYVFDHYDFASMPDRYREDNLGKAERSDIQNILGRKYDGISIRSVFMGSGESDNFYLPVISAMIGMKTFDNTAMSQAELWAYFVHWVLEDQIHRGGLALLDELETSLAPRGQRFFIDHVARIAVRNRLQLIVATHSPEMLSRFPLANIRMCLPEDSGIRIRVPKSLYQIREAIGIDTPIRGIVLVEDELAKQLLGHIFALHDTALTREMDIINVGGQGNVIKTLTSLGSRNRLVCLGVLDADQRGNDSADQQRKDSATAEKSRNQVFFLPGSKSPEEELLENGLMEAQRISTTIGAGAEDIIIAVSSCRDLDHQYQIGSVARFLGYPEAEVTSVLASAWLRQPQIAHEAERLASAIRKALSAGR